MSKPAVEPPKTIRRAPIATRAANYVKDLYTATGWQVQMTPRGGLTTFTASRANKYHHVRVVLGEDTWVDGEKVNFNQNAVANKASAIVATYIENTAKDGTVTARASLFDINENKPVRLVMPRAQKEKA